MGVIEDGTAKGCLPIEEMFAVHYPAYPSSMSRAVETLGGVDAIAKARSSKLNKLELRFRPEDPCSHPAFGQIHPCNNLLLKISKGGIGSSKSKEYKPILSADIIARVPEAYNFSGDNMASASANSGSSNASVSSDFPNEDANSPLWKYVTRVSKTGGGGNWKWTCNFCLQEKHGSYTRVRAHLLKIPCKGIGACSKVKQGDTLEMIRSEQKVGVKAQNTKPIKAPSPSNSPILIPQYSSNPISCNVGKKRKSMPLLVRSFDNQNEHRALLDSEIARMFYSGGLPFTLARNPYYLSSYTFAANHNLPGYVPPGYNSLTTKLLDQEKARVERSLEPIKSTWKEDGVSIVSYGWSDPQSRPVINIMATSVSWPIFLKSVDSFGEIKDKYFIANLMKKVIDEVGHEKVVQIITDNSLNCKGAGELIEGMYPMIYWTPCVVQILNLALKIICAAKNVDSSQETYDECHWITVVHGDAVQIKNFITSHTMRLAIFNKFASLKLLSVADTRLASGIVMLKRFKLLRCSLQAMVMSDEWISYCEDYQGIAKFVKEKVMDDCWWDRVSYILDFCAPVYEMIRECDTNKPQLHLVYEQWDSMIKKVKLSIFKHEGKRISDQSSFYDVVYAILVARWSKSNTPLHCLAYSLNPRYYSDRWLHEDLSRLPPHRDEDISKERIKCFKRLYPDDELYDQIMFEYGNFARGLGKFANHDSLSRRYTLCANSWWTNFGACAPLLQSLAFKVLGQPTSSSCCERNWSTYSFIHSLRKNKFTPRRVEDLVFLHNNLRLLSRNSAQYEEERTKYWDIGGDEFGTMEEMGILQFAELSLDEPELEQCIFQKM